MLLVTQTGTIDMADPHPRPRRGLSAAQIMIATIVAALVFGGVVGFVSSWRETELGTENPSALLGWGLLIGLPLACLVTIPYWMRLDEAAREAHKAAWLWGGGAAYTLAAMGAALLAVSPIGATVPSILKRTDGAGRFADGVLFTVVLQSFGYGAAWLIWWARKR